MLKIYKYNGRTFQYEKGEQPEGAVEVKAEPPKADKTVKPANKAKAVKTK